VRALLAVWLLGLTASLSPALSAAAQAAGAAGGTAFELQVLNASAPNVTPQSVASGSLDSYFEPFNLRQARQAGPTFWLKLRARGASEPTGNATPVLLARKGRHFQVLPKAQPFRAASLHCPWQQLARRFGARTMPSSCCPHRSLPVKRSTRGSMRVARDRKS
jgi:hypothetical protein